MKKIFFGGQSKWLNNTNQTNQKSTNESLIMKINKGCGELKGTNLGGGIWSINSYPSSNEHGGSNGGFSGGNSSNYVATDNDLRIRTIYKSLENNYYGCQGDNSRKEKGDDSLCSSLKYVINEIKLYNGYSPTAKAFIFSDCDLTAHDTNYLSTNLPNNAHNFILVDFSHNPQIGALGVDYLLKGATGILSLQSGKHDINLMYQGVLTRPNFNIVKLNLENCNIGDIGADILGHALVSGKLPAKEIDVSGNNITDKGEDFFVKVLNDPTVHHIAITIENLGHNLKLQSAKKEHIVPELHNILEKAEKRGVDVKNMVVDLSFLTWVKNIWGTTKIATRGFIKCKWTDDPIGDWAKGKLASKLPKKVAKFIDKALDTEGTVSCYLKAHDQAATSEFGAQTAINDLYIIGENYVPENIE